MLGSTGCFPNSSSSSLVNSGGAARLQNNGPMKEQMLSTPATTQGGLGYF